MMESLALLFVGLGFGSVEDMTDPDEERDSSGMCKEDKDLLLYYQKAKSLMSDAFENIRSIDFDSGPEDEDLLAFLGDDADEGPV
jgi:hypothetical protein